MSVKDTTTLRKMTRAELLEMLVEQSKSVAAMRQNMEKMQAELDSKDVLLNEYKERLTEKENMGNPEVSTLKEDYQKLQGTVASRNAMIRELQNKLDAERRLRMESLLNSRTITEATQYMNQMLEDTKIAAAQYQKIIIRLANKLKEGGTQ